MEESAAGVLSLVVLCSAAVESATGDTHEPRTKAESKVRKINCFFIITS